MSKINEINALKRRIRVLIIAIGLLFSPALLADYEDGVNAAFKGDFETALHEFTLAAEEGLDLAQYNLAILYFTGQGVEKDMAEAFRWTEAAAAQGHVAAQFNLGNLYYAGDGVQMNRAKAVAMFESAAKGGHPNAALILANMYADGEVSGDTEPGLLARIARFFGAADGDDLVLAHAWANMAIANESEQGEALRAELESCMSAQQISDARRQFALWQIE